MGVSGVEFRAGAALRDPPRRREVGGWIWEGPGRAGKGEGQADQREPETSYPEALNLAAPAITWGLCYSMISRAQGPGGGSGLPFS